MPGDFFGLAGRVIDGQFHVLEVAGEGGFSVVYRGHHLTLREPVAIKCLKFKHKNEAIIASFTQRFFDESRIMYRLSQGNLNIVRAITTGVTMSPSTGASVPYMVLEWLSGVPVSKVLKDLRVKKGPGMSLGATMQLFEPAALAVAYAHSQGVVHRDLKPGNLFLQSASASKSGPIGLGTMKVLDFGMAKVLSPEAMGGLESAETLGGVVVLSPQYVTPEQLDKAFGPIGPWTDVYAFALILVEALTARRARDAEAFADLMVQITKNEDVPTPRKRGADVSDAVEHVFARALARDAKARYPDLGAFWQDLKTAAAKLPEPDFDDRTSIDQPINFSTTLLLPPQSKPRSFSETMPLRASEAPVAPATTPSKWAGTMPLRVTPPAMEAVVPPARASASSLAPAPPPPQAPPPPEVEQPPVIPVTHGRGVLVVFLVLFILASLGVSGFVLFTLLRRS